MPYIGRVLKHIVLTDYLVYSGMVYMWAKAYKLKLHLMKEVLAGNVSVTVMEIVSFLKNNNNNKKHGLHLSIFSSEN